MSVTSIFFYVSVQRKFLRNDLFEAFHSIFFSDVISRSKVYSRSWGTQTN